MSTILAMTKTGSQLSEAIAKKVGMEGQGCMFYLNPVMIPYTRRHVTLEHRGQHIMKQEDLSWKVVDVAGHRLFAVLYNPLYHRELGTTRSRNLDSRR